MLCLWDENIINYCLGSVGLRWGSYQIQHRLNLQTICNASHALGQIENMESIHHLIVNGKHIVLGITGGIAAYKSADLTRRLMEAGTKVRIVMTRAATGFVTPLTFQALSGEQVFVDGINENTDTPETNAMKHIDLARWAEALLIASKAAPNTAPSAGLEHMFNLHPNLTSFRFLVGHGVA